VLRRPLHCLVHQMLGPPQPEQPSQSLVFTQHSLYELRNPMGSRCSTIAEIQCGLGPALVGCFSRLPHPSAHTLSDPTGLARPLAAGLTRRPCSTRMRAPALEVHSLSPFVIGAKTLAEVPRPDAGVTNGYRQSYPDTLRWKPPGSEWKSPTADRVVTGSASSCRIEGRKNCTLDNTPSKTHRLRQW